MSALVNIIQILGNASEEPQGIAALGIDPLAILAQAGTFLVLFYIVKKYALEKIVNTLEERRKTIDDGVRIGRQMEVERQKLEATIEAELTRARKEADNIIATAHQESGAILEQAQESAQHRAASLLADAHVKIDEDIIRARQGLEKDIRELVAEATAVILEEKLEAKKDMSLIDRALAKVRNA